MDLAIASIVGLLIGSVMTWLALRSRNASQQARLSLVENELTSAKSDVGKFLDEQRKLIESRARLESALDSERKTSLEKVELLTKASDRSAQELQNAFKALAADALRSNSSSFLQIAQESLKRFQSQAEDDLE